SECTALNSSNGCIAPSGTQATTTANGGITLTGTGILDGRTLVNVGTATVSTANSYALELLDGAQLTNQLAATWNITADSSIYGPAGTSTPTINNAGL